MELAFKVPSIQLEGHSLSSNRFSASYERTAIVFIAHKTGLVGTDDGCHSVDAGLKTQLKQVINVQVYPTALFLLGVGWRSTAHH